MKFTTHLGLQSQTTRLYERMSYAASSRSKTGLSPSMIPFSKGVIPRSHADNTSLDYNSMPSRSTDFKLELFPLHSPLLGESLLVSFPPLNNMLKFSGWSHRCQGVTKVVCSYTICYNLPRKHANYPLVGQSVQKCPKRSNLPSSSRYVLFPASERGL